MMEQAFFRNKSIEEVEDFWDKHPCNIRHSPSKFGTRNYFDEVEARKYFVEQHIPRFAEFERWRGKRVLEVGCGIGTDTINFARCGAWVTAVELSGRSLEIARQRAELYGLEDRIRFYRANAEELSRVVPVEPYDLVYTFGVIHHTPRPDRVMAQIRHYVHPASTVKLMVYQRHSWKVLWIGLMHGKGRVWQLTGLVAKYSEAQEGCPVTITFTKKEVGKLLNDYGFKPTDMWIDHIFPYRISDYVEYRFKKVWYFRWMPRPLFRWLEQHFGWHLCVTARIIKQPA